MLLGEGRDEGVGRGDSGWAEAGVGAGRGRDGKGVNVCMSEGAARGRKRWQQLYPKFTLNRIPATVTQNPKPCPKKGQQKVEKRWQQKKRGDNNFQNGLPYLICYNLLYNFFRLKWNNPPKSRKNDDWKRRELQKRFCPNLKKISGCFQFFVPGNFKTPEDFCWVTSIFVFLTHAPWATRLFIFFWAGDLFQFQLGNVIYKITTLNFERWMQFSKLSALLNLLCRFLFVIKTPNNFWEFARARDTHTNTHIHTYIYKIRVKGDEQAVPAEPIMLFYLYRLNFMLYYL